MHGADGHGAAFRDGVVLAVLVAADTGVADVAAEVTGIVIRFDDVKGYGFIAPAGGGEDVFLHVNELVDFGTRPTAGARVGFRIVDSGRGLKAECCSLRYLFLQSKSC